MIEQNIINNRERIDTEIFHNEDKYYMNIFLQVLFIVHVDCYIIIMNDKTNENKV